MSYTQNAVVAHQFTFPDFQFTMNVSGSVTAADVGKAVTLDATASNTVKLAGADDVVIGRLETVETGGLDGLTVGAVARKFRAVLPTTGTVEIGDQVVGSATAGVVKSMAAQPALGAKTNIVIEVLTGNRAVVELL